MLGVMVVLTLPGTALAAIQGVTGPSFTLTAKTGFITVDDGTIIPTWGFANGTGLMQYPGPTLIVNQGDLVSVALTNQLTVPVSILFPGQQGVVATGGVPGLLTNEAPPAGTVTYTFTAGEPGTFTYYSGSQPELQFEMGLVGVLIVRPTGQPKRAYADPATAFDREYLFFLSDMDPLIHKKVQQGFGATINQSSAWPICWFINGRAGLDTIAPAFDPIMPYQPYSAVALMHPGEKVLLRMVGGGRDAHPFHVHGNHHKVIARDGRQLKAGALDISEGAFTTTVAPGQTHDALFTWTGAGQGWDVYGHTASDPLAPGESADDHGLAFPTILPDIKDLLPGPLYPGSPFLGGSGSLPPGEGGFNPWGAFPFMWHSHNEKELTSADIFPGGMLTWVLIVPPGTLPAE